MAKIKIIRDKCKGCLLCVGVCPKGLLEPDEKLNRRGIKPVKFSRHSHLNKGGIPPAQSKAGKGNPECLGCAMCAIICPDCCIEVFK